jgi:hypothetical protein
MNSIKGLQSQGTTFAFAGSANFHERVTDGVRAWQQRESLDAAFAGLRR